MTTPDEQARPDHAAASTDVLAGGGGGRPTRLKAIVVGAVVVVVLLAAAGAAVAAKLAGGGGAQPESVIPASAMAFAKLDLDPSAGQKLAAFRFAAKFPGIGDKLNPDDDLAKKLFDVAVENGALTGIDYDTDVKPWLGKRVGVALLPAPSGSTEPVPVVAVQVTDAAAAKAGLAKLSAASGEGSKASGFALSGDYAVIASSDEVARAAVSQAETASLAADHDFGADLDALGASGVAASWVDLSDLGALANAAAGQRSATPAAELRGLLDLKAQGRLATVLRFDGPTLELVAHVSGSTVAVKPAGGGVTNHLGDLPASTLAAVSVNHPDHYVDALLTALPATLGANAAPIDAMLAQFQAQTGLTLPGDLMTLLGSNLVVAVDADGLRDSPKVGARVVTDPVKATALLDRLEQGLWQLVGGPVALPRDETSDGYVVATTPGYAAELKKAGELGSAARFTDALPHVDEADAAAYVDVATLVDSYAQDLGASPDQLANLRPLAALGATVTNEGHGGASYLLRLTTR